MLSKSEALEKILNSRGGISIATAFSGFSSHRGGYHPNIEDLPAFDFWWKLGILEKIKDANTPSGTFRFTENAAKKIGLTPINSSYDRAKFLKLVEENLARI